MGDQLIYCQNLHNPIKINTVFKETDKELHYQRISSCQGKIELQFSRLEGHKL